MVQFDEFVAQYEFHNPAEGVVPDEEEHVEFSPFQGEPVTQLGEGSSSAWSTEPSSWEDPRSSVYAPKARYDQWTYQYYPGAGGSSWSPQYLSPT